MEAYHIWIIVGLLLITAEIISMEFIFSCFGLAALITSIGSYFDISFKLELTMFCISSMLLFITIRPIVKHRLLSKKISTGSDAFIGTEHFVTETIDEIKTYDHDEL